MIRSRRRRPCRRPCRRRCRFLSHLSSASLCALSPMSLTATVCPTPLQRRWATPVAPTSSHRPAPPRRRCTTRCASSKRSSRGRRRNWTRARAWRRASNCVSWSAHAPSQSPHYSAPQTPAYRWQYRTCSRCEQFCGIVIGCATCFYFECVW